MNPHPYQCSSCGAGIALADVNVSTDIALCRACGKTMPFSDIAPVPGSADMDLSRPPKGVRIEASLDLQTWGTVESGIAGNDGQIQRFYSTRNVPKRYFRVEEDGP